MLLSLINAIQCVPEVSSLRIRILTYLEVMWIRIHLGPWIWRYKMKGNAEFNKFFWCIFRSKLSFSSMNLKKVAKGLGTDLKIKSLFEYKICFEINLIILWTWIGTGSVFIKFSGSGYNQSGSTDI